jgi:hypothetical protein
MKENNLCPCCGKTICNERQTNVVLYKEKNDPIVKPIRLSYCTECNLPFTTKRKIKQIASDNLGYRPITFIVNEGELPEKVLSLICSDHSRENNKNYYLESSPYEIVKIGGYTYSKLRNIKSISENNIICPKCSSAIRNGYTYIPLGENRYSKVLGRVCDNCECLYTTRKNSVKELLMDNVNAVGFELDGEQLWNYSINEEKRQRAIYHAHKQAEHEKRMAERKAEREQKLAPMREVLNNVPSSVVYILTSSVKGMLSYVIVNDIIYQDRHKRILHYTDELARELLTAAYVESRNKCGKYENIDFKVQQIVYQTSDINELSSQMTPHKLAIKKGGGYYSYNSTSGIEEIVDLLLYSPYTDRYETIRATYNKFNDFCYIDISKFREFISEYGNPKHVNINFICDISNQQLKQESILKIYGYSVSDADGLSPKYRQALLSELVDVGILTVPEVVNLLNFFIRIHSNAEYRYACDKWQADKEYIENYQVNPQRFLIAEERPIKV